MAKKPFTPIPPMAELPPVEEIDVKELLDKYLAGEIDLICVLGPTASGKTKYAVRLARQINELLKTDRAEILSADSRQVYRGMDIGTGKDLGEYEEIPYHLMDIVDAGTKYNIFEYQRDFEKAYKDIVDRGGIPILCGGSGLYIEAATCGYSLPEVPPDPQLRAELEKKSDEELIAQLASLKPLHNNTDYDTRKRLIRALEIAIFEAEHPVNRSSFLPKNTYYIGTLVSREVRNARIDARPTFAFGFQDTRRPAVPSPSGAPLACLRQSRGLHRLKPDPQHPPATLASQDIAHAHVRAHAQIDVPKRGICLVQLYCGWIYAWESDC